MTPAYERVTCRSAGAVRPPIVTSVLWRDERDSVGAATTMRRSPQRNAEDTLRATQRTVAT